MLPMSASSWHKKATKWPPTQAHRKRQSNLEKFPLGRAELMGFDYIPLGRLVRCASSSPEASPREPATAKYQQSHERLRSPLSRGVFYGAHQPVEIPGSIEASAVDEEGRRAVDAAAHAGVEIGAYP